MMDILTYFHISTYTHMVSHISKYHIRKDKYQPEPEPVFEARSSWNTILHASLHPGSSWPALGASGELFSTYPGALPWSTTLDDSTVVDLVAAALQAR